MPESRNDGDDPWWIDSVVYQIYPRSFADSNGDGIGDLPGIIARLDYLAELGVDVVWLSPVYPSPQDDNGYDISDYQGIEPTFGSLADFDDLIQGLHARGIKLVMDLVVNHTSDEHPWFIESRSSRDNPKRDWYWWRDAREGMPAGSRGSEPTNWGSFFSGNAWAWDAKTEQYYLHLFSTKQPDLNWENEEVRQAVYSMMNWWLDRGVDGFRMDVINLISKDPSLPDGLVHPGSLHGDGWPHFVCGPRIHEFLQEMHREVFEGRKPVPLTVGEMPGVTLDQARLFTDPARRELDMVFQFEHMGVDTVEGQRYSVRPLDLRDLKTTLGRWQSGLSDVGWNSLYWDNHDQPRAVSRFGDDSAEYRVASAQCLATLLHLQRGTPYVYQGEELGMTNAPFESIDDFRDIEARNHYAEAVQAGQSPESVLAVLRAKSRDHARTPMPWDTSDQAGFTSGTPWMPLNPNYPTINAAVDRADPHSVFHHYRALIDLRHSEPAITHGDFTMLLPDDPAVYAFTRKSPEVELLVVCNVSSEFVDVNLPEDRLWAGAEVLLRTPESARGATLSSRLAPWEARVLRRIP